MPPLIEVRSAKARGASITWAEKSFAEASPWMMVQSMTIFCTPTPDHSTKLTPILPRAFDGKVESMMVDSQDGANQIQHRHWDKGASHEWGSHIPTICANVSLRQSRPVIPVRKLLSCSTWL